MLRMGVRPAGAWQHGNAAGSLGFAPVRSSRRLWLNDAESAHTREPARTAPRVDKLGVTGSSPVPPIESPALGLFCCSNRRRSARSWQGSRPIRPRSPAGETDRGVCPRAPSQCKPAGTQLRGRGQRRTLIGSGTLNDGHPYRRIGGQSVRVPKNELHVREAVACRDGEPLPVHGALRGHVSARESGRLPRALSAVSEVTARWGGGE